MEDEEGYEVDYGMSPLAEASVMLHEIYQSLTIGGFSNDEALRIVAYMITEADIAGEYET